MISKIDIRNFKSIREMQVDCSKLNVFIGVNSSGKSSVLQALLFALQNVHEPIGINGRFIRLGKLANNRCLYSDEKTISVRIDEDNEFLAEMKLYAEGTATRVSRRMSTDMPDRYSIAGRKSQYLSCHRLGPQDIYKDNDSVEGGLGNEGEFAMAYLHRHRSDVVEPQICKNKEDYTLLGQVNWWLNYITEAKVYPESIEGTNLVLATYQMHDLKNLSPWNVGSGISYLISLLIVCLASPEESLIVIENPEIHLHPSAQSKVCEFLYYIAQAGRQLFVETHSDHIFNGFRAGIATKEMDGENINIQFISLNDEHVSENMRVQIGSMGRIENQRKDLFDQFDLDLNKMIGLRRK